MAVFLPSMSPATSVQRDSVSSASSCMRCSAVLRSGSSVSDETLSVAAFAAWANPRTSASFSSRTVSSAMSLRLLFAVGLLHRTTGSRGDRSARLCRESGEARQDLARPGVEEGVLLGADLLDEELV